MKAIQPGWPTTMQMTFAITRYKNANTQIQYTGLHLMSRDLHMMKIVFNEAESL